jgi:flagellar basal-body rod modification protein FlgD
MQIHNLSTPATTSSTASTSSSSSSSTSTAGLDSSDFMSLLVAEIQNQDPTQPLDPTTFMSQLVQLNTLEQTMDINSLLQEEFGASSTTSTSSTTG